MGAGGRSSVFPAKRNPIHKLQKMMSGDYKSPEEPTSPRSIKDLPLDLGPTPPSTPVTSAQQQPAETVAPLSPGEQLYTIDIPAEAKPGMTLKVRLPNTGMVKITVPEDCVPGTTLEFSLPKATAEDVARWAATEVVNAACDDAMAMQQVAHDAECEKFAAKFAEEVCEKALAQAASGNGAQGFANVVGMATTAAKSGRLWGLVSSITDKLSLAAYADADDEVETAEENPFRWF